MTQNATESSSRAIRPIDSHSAHRITTGQVIIDLQTAAKELVENALDAGATNIEVRFKDYGLKSIEVIDNGSGITPEDYESIALKHHTSKLASFSDLTSVVTFGFRGEALSSLCALSEGVTVTTATATQSPMGTILVFDSAGRLTGSSGKVARQRGTTITVTGLFAPLPVRRKELERHAKREFTKALNLLTAYALVPCTRENNGVVLTVSNTPDGGKKTTQLRTDGATSVRASVGALWGPKQLDHLIDLDVSFDVMPEKSVLRRREGGDVGSHRIRVQGLISKFAPGAGRTGTDRQFYFINGRPCAPAKVQKAVNEVYRTFNANQSPFVIADFVLPTDSCDINVSPDKRTILLHSENNLVEALKVALTETFDSARSNFVLNATQVALAQKEAEHTPAGDTTANKKRPLFIPEDEDQLGDNLAEKSRDTMTLESEDEPMSTSGAGTTPLPKELPTITSSPLEGPLSSQKRARPASPDPISDGEANPPKKTRPSPPAPDPALPTSSQRLAGPGRTPARVEQILSENTGSARGPVQMVLNTSGASWNLKPGQEGPPRKRSLPGDVITGVSARVNMRARLAGFARDGAQVVQDDEDESDSDSLEEEEGVEQTAADKRSSSPKKTASDVDSPDIGSEGRSSTDVVDDTIMIVDSSESEDESMKLHDDVSRAAATAISTRPPKPDDDFTSNEELPLDSSSDGAPSSVVAVALPPLPNDRVRTEVVRTIVGYAPPLAFDLERTTSAWSAYLGRRSTLHPPQPATRSSDLESADLGADDENATATLARVLSKADFGLMNVVGQFNKGFIVARLRKTGGDGATDDLFIVDQHAADEKYNFETLQATTRLESQRLFTPRVLELTAADELVAVENLGVLQQNGFEVAQDDDQPAGRRLKLLAQPVSKKTEFDVQDLEEILHLLRDRPSGTLVRSSKTRAMFAMRACRKSTMVGAPLNARQMTTIIRHMGTMEQPWNCPHGRPTMRHLSDVGAMVRRREKAVDWAAFVPR